MYLFLCFFIFLPIPHNFNYEKERDNIRDDAAAEQTEGLRGGPDVEHVRPHLGTGTIGELPNTTVGQSHHGRE